MPIPAGSAGSIPRGIRPSARFSRSTSSVRSRVSHGKKRQARFLRGSAAVPRGRHSPPWPSARSRSMPHSRGSSRGLPPAAFPSPAREPTFLASCRKDRKSEASPGDDSWKIPQHAKVSRFRFSGTVSISNHSFFIRILFFKQFTTLRI